MPLAGSNLQAGNVSFLTKLFLRKMGLKPRSKDLFFGPTARLGLTTDDGTTFPRKVTILAKYSATAPTTNTANDNPTGVGDICIHCLNTGGAARIQDQYIDIYRCTVYTNTTTFTWVKIID